MSDQQHEVVVHKAKINLNNGESVRQYTMELSRSGADAIRKAVTLGPKDSVFMIEAFSDSAVFDVWKDSAPAGKRHTFMKMSYTRDKEGKFSFGTPSEVVRVSTFKPKPGLNVTKNAEGESTEDVCKAAWRPFWEGAQL